MVGILNNLSTSLFRSKIRIPGIYGYRLPGCVQSQPGNLMLNASIPISYVFTTQLFMYFIFIDLAKRDLKICRRCESENENITNS